MRSQKLALLPDSASNLLCVVSKRAQTHTDVSMSTTNALAREITHPELCWLPSFSFFFPNTKHRSGFGGRQLITTRNDGLGGRDASALGGGQYSLHLPFLHASSPP